MVTIDRGTIGLSRRRPVNIHDLGNKVQAQMHNPQSDAVYLALR